MTDKLSHLTRAALTAAKRHGAESADVIAVESTSLSIDVRSGTLEQAERSEGVELGLRVLIGQRQACVSVSDTRSDSIETLAERAVAMARLAPVDPYAGLAEPEQLATEWDVAQLDLVDDIPPPTPEVLEELALNCEAAAAAVPGVATVDGASAALTRTAIHLSASNGFSGGHARTGFGLSAVAISGTGLGMERDYYGDMRLHLSDLLPAEEIGRHAGERAAARAGARKPPSGAFPVMYDERVSSTLIGHILQAINGSAISRGASWLKDAMESAILPPQMSLIEDPTRPRVTGSRPFDAEGLPVARRSIVEEGVLKSWVLDLATARKLGLSSTGNASRGTGAPPSPSAGNITLMAPTRTKADMLSDMGTGLLVTSLIGNSINPTTGDYSRGASGFWVENGQVAYPVNECTIAGNLKAMLMTFQAADDARPHLSRVVPSLLVEGMTLAGA